MADSSTDRFVPEYRRLNFKNRNRFAPEELRRRREKHHISLRKLKRDEELLKRRKVHTKDLFHQDLEIRIEDGATPDQVSNPALVPQLTLILALLQLPENHSLALDALKTLLVLLSPTLSDTTPPIEELIQLGLVPVLMRFMADSTEYEFQYQLLWALANIATGTELHTKSLIDNYKIIPLLLNLLGLTTSISLKEELLLCLGNLCIDNLNGEEVRNTIIIGGGLVKLIEILIVEDDEFGTSSMGLKRKASWVFMQLCKTDRYGRLPSSNWNVLRYIIPQLYYILEHSNQDSTVLSDLLRAVEYLTHEFLTNNRSTTIMDFNLHSLLIKRFLAGSNKMQNLKIITIRIMKNLITASSQRLTPTLVEENLLRCILQIFSYESSSDELKKECCQLIGMMNQCSLEVIQQIFDMNLIPHVIHLLKNGRQFDLRLEACNALCNAIQFSKPLPSLINLLAPGAQIGSESAKIIPFLVLQGILQPLMDLLLMAPLDMQFKILRSLERILATGEYLHQIGDSGHNEYVFFLVELGGKDILESLINDAMNDEESELNTEFLLHVERILKFYINISDNQRYDLQYSAASSDMSSSDYQFQFNTMEEKLDVDDDDSTMMPAIGDDGFFKFG